MIDTLLNSKQIKELENYDTPTICNAIESFKIQKNTVGFMSPAIRSMIPYDRPVLGYACTAKISALEPATSAQKELTTPYFEKFAQFKLPTIAVIEDIDEEPIGSFWGGINSSIHMALGCKGVVTNGGIRDLKDVEEIGFRYFSKYILVSHAYVHLTEIDCMVEVGGLKIKPGDLIHADIHGVTTIPSSIAGKLAKACKEVFDSENYVIEKCKQKIGKGIDVSYIQKLRKEMYQKRDRLRK